MPETVGTLNLKIARLQRRLRLLEQQQAMSSMYPAHKANLVRRTAQVQIQLNQLIQSREELSPSVTDSLTERLFARSHNRQPAFYPAY